MELTLSKECEEEETTADAILKMFRLLGAEMSKEVSMLTR